MKQETKDKISSTLKILHLEGKLTTFKKGHKFYPNSGMFKKGHIPAIKGKTKKDFPKLSNAGTKKGFPGNRLGTKPSSETRLKMRLSRLGKYRGEKSCHWKGNKTAENIMAWSWDEMKIWRKSVFTRDDYTCQACRVKGGYLHPHHVKNFSEWPELRVILSNGITLCKSCHYKFHKQYGFRNNTLEQVNKFLIDSMDLLGEEEISSPIGGGGVH